ncbi:ankyrin-1 [Exaiptasia diaphana]|uniref:SOCS box domain-containing protein n=1 Tax=Exaiptasia diaphana TaxID=2652724 RepID=A0A913XLH2_EXADI|nr:ankyrin-1 [Exaiptasia diaphana]KXJ11019.1 Ankyrin-1 [Exaiptasia diaphana]
MEGQQYDNFIANYTGRRPAPLSALDKFLNCLRDGDLVTAKKLFTEKKFNPNASAPNRTGHAPGIAAIHIATREGHLDCVEFLVENGADVNLTEARRKTPLHFAAGGGHLELVKFLVKHKAALDLIDKFGRTPIVWATSAQHIDVVKELLEAGASISQGNWHPLHEACKNGNLQIAKTLISAGAPVNTPSEFKGCKPWSPLHIATREGNLDCVNMLIDAGADVQAKNAGGHTSLHEAAYRGFTGIVKRLLQENANSNSQNNQKRTPLHEACAQGKVSCALCLLDAGSKPNSQDMIFETPLHLALRARHPPPTAIALMTVLLQYGASPSLIGNNDETPFDILIDTSQTECLEMLEDALENPRTLKQMCKVLIRRKLKFSLGNKVNRLPLPLPVQYYLTDDDIEDDLRGE